MSAVLMATIVRSFPSGETRDAKVTAQLVRSPGCFFVPGVSQYTSPAPSCAQMR